MSVSTLATIGRSALYFSSAHSWVGSEQVLYELFLTPNWYYHTVPSRDTTTVCAQLVSPHVEKLQAFVRASITPAVPNSSENLL